MSKGYIRCHYIDDESHQCEKWIPTPEDDAPKLCPSHSGVLSVAQVVNNGGTGDKKKYIDRVNEFRIECSKMTFDQLTDHIAEVEKRLEEARTELLTKRAVRAERIEAMTEEERKELRTFKVPKEKATASKTKPSLKKDPLKFMMEKYPNLTEQQVKGLLGL